MKIRNLITYSLSIMISLFSISSVFAETVSNIEISKDEKLNSDKLCVLSKEQIPEAIDYEVVLEKGHCKRNKEAEKALNSFIFSNLDGTQSCYFFNYPVKYIDESGIIKDKSNIITRNDSTSDFLPVASDIETVFSYNLMHGIHLNYEDINITMTPDFVNNNQEIIGELSNDEKIITYKCDDVSLEYSLTYQGVKENIILEEYSEKNEFTFLLSTGGLELKSDNLGNINLYNSDNESVANIGNIIAYDSNDNVTKGIISYQEIEEKEKYSLVVSVSDDFLMSTSTVYPVCIDPTIEIDYTHYEQNQYYDGPAITHCSINSENEKDFSGPLVVGKKSSKIYRTLMKFPILYSNYATNSFGQKVELGFLAMKPEQINSMKVYLKDVGYQGDHNAIDVYCHEFKNSWGQSVSFSWGDNLDEYDSQYLDVQNISYTNGLLQNPINTYCFDITDLAKRWVSNPSMSTKANFGIMLKASDTVENDNNALYCSFGSYNSMYYSPYLVLDYSIPYDYQNVENAQISYTFKKSIYLNAGQRYIYKTGESSDYGSYNTELYLFKSDMEPGEHSWYNDDSNGIFSEIDVTIQESGRYILMAKCHDVSGRGGVANSGYCNVYQVNPQTNTESLVEKNAKLGGYILALPNSISYNNDIYNSFTANDGDCDTVMYILSENTSNNKKVIGYNDDYNGNGDFYWGTSSRVKQYYNNNNKPRYIYVTSYSESSTGIADIYGICNGTYVKSEFPNLKEDDSIVSAPSSRNYNCIAYSGGLTHEWINPNFKTSGGGFLLPWYNDNPIIALDNYYGNNPPRYIGAITYTVTTNPLDAVVNVYKNGDSWTHASVRKPANNQPHGYAWESKLGINERIFHDLNSLSNISNATSTYGNIERRYKIEMSSYTFNSDECNYISFDDSVKEGNTQLLNVKFSNDELDYLFSKFDSVDISKRKRFYFLINELQERITKDPKLNVISDSTIYADTNEYKILSDYIDKNIDLIYCILCDKVERRNSVITDLLFNDKVVNRNLKTISIANNVRERNNAISIASLDIDDSTKKKVTSDNKLNTYSGYIAPSYNSNVICFIKDLIRENSEGKILFN